MVYKKKEHQKKKFKKLGLVKVGRH